MGEGALTSPLDVAWGAEWRQETFESVAGDLASYQAGPFSDQGFSIGSNGYQGLHPRNAGKWSRPNYALYLDIQADVAPPLQLGLAVRYEDFGNTLNGKLSALWRATDRVTLRSTANTGFRAPSPRPWAAWRSPRRNPWASRSAPPWNSPTNSS